MAAPLTRSALLRTVVVHSDEVERAGAPGARGARVDAATEGWHGSVGVVSDLVGRLRIDSERTTALVCGPEIMMRHSALGLLERGVAADDIFVSMERNMKCATAICGHCQFGPHFICKDGPVFPYPVVNEFFGVREF